MYVPALLFQISGSLKGHLKRDAGRALMPIRKTGLSLNYCYPVRQCPQRDLVDEFARCGAQTAQHADTVRRSRRRQRRVRNAVLRHHAANIQGFDAVPRQDFRQIRFQKTIRVRLLHQRFVRKQIRHRGMQVCAVRTAREQRRPFGRNVPHTDNQPPVRLRPVDFCRNFLRRFVRVFLREFPARKILVLHIDNQ